MEEAKIITKDDERKALEEIEKIVADLGKDSYVGTAFDGAFAIAKRNIENDWMESVAEIIKAKEKAEMECGRMDEIHREAIDDLAIQLVAEKEKNEQLNNLHEESGKNLRQANREYLDETNQLRYQIETDKQEIMRLKAKLYDMMTEGKEDKYQ